MPAALLVIAAAVLWGTTGTAQALGPDGIDPLAVGWIRLAVGGLGLAAVSAVGRGGPLTAPLPRGWLAIAVVSVAAYQLTFFGGVRLAGVALGTAVGIGSAPLWGGAVDWRMVGWRPSRRWLLATVVAIVGAVLIAGQPGRATGVGLGLGLAVGAGLSYAVYSYALQQLARVGPADRVSAIVFLLAAVALAPVAIASGSDGLPALVTGAGVLMSLHLGLVATTASYALFTRGIRDTPVSSAMLLSMAEPLTAVVLGVVVLGESVSARAAVGVALLLAGVTLAATQRQRPARPPGDGSGRPGSPTGWRGGGDPDVPAGH